MGIERIFIGLYSGWAAEGVDAVMVSMSGRKPRLKVHQLHQSHLPYSEELRKRILDASGEMALTMSAFAQLDKDVSMALGEAAAALVKNAGVKASQVAAIGSSGQIISRLARANGARQSAAFVLELGTPSLIASHVRAPIAGQFGQSDAAAGGVGGPVTAWADWLLYADKRLSRAAIHLGGITSLTFIGSDAHPMDVVAFDVGPGTILIDALTSELYGRPYDVDGSFAARGKVHASLLNEMLANPYFRQPAPKVSDRQQWGPLYVSRLKMMAQRHRCTDEDVVATATELVARGVTAAIATLTERPHEIILSGGGARNINLASRIRTLLSPSSTISSERFGYSLRAKQAVCMAVLAAARLDKQSIYCPFATGMKRPAVPGCLFLPGDDEASPPGVAR